MSHRQNDNCPMKAGTTKITSPTILLRHNNDDKQDTALRRVVHRLVAMFQRHDRSFRLPSAGPRNSCGVLVPLLQHPSRPWDARQEQEHLTEVMNTLIQCLVILK